MIFGSEMRFSSDCVFVVIASAALAGCDHESKAVPRPEPLPSFHGIDAGTAAAVSGIANSVGVCMASFEETFAHPHTDNCPVARIPLRSGAEVAIADLSNSKAGTESRVWISADRKSVVKSLKDARTDIIPEFADWLARFVFRGLCNERAVSAISGNCHGAVAGMYEVAPGALPRTCAAVTGVFEFAGQYSLSAIQQLSKKEQAAVAAAAVRLVKRIHESGIIHGDVHEDNFMFASLVNPDTTLRAIDLGRASNWVELAADGSLKHVEFETRELGPGLSWDLLSVWELEGARPSRRDDMLRLANALFNSLAMELKTVQTACDRKSGKSVDDCVAAKRERRTEGRLGAFYNEMLGLEFTDRPDYEYWAAVFDEASESGNGLLSPLPATK